MAEFPWISRINDDILGLIFLHNTLHDDDFAELGFSNPNNVCLITARDTSQVCSRWRSAILNSPLLWANIIDLDHLNQQNDHWTIEVIERTKTCPLSVRGHLGMRQRDYVSSFFMDLLSKHWSRFRRLQIYVTNPWADDRRWDTLERPAPYL